MGYKCIRKPGIEALRVLRDESPDRITLQRMAEVRGVSVTAASHNMNHLVTSCLADVVKQPGKMQAITKFYGITPFGRRFLHHFEETGRRLPTPETPPIDEADDDDEPPFEPAPANFVAQVVKTQPSSVFDLARVMGLHGNL